MFPQFYTAASGLIAGERTLEVGANNLANVNTPAYQGEHPLFATYVAAALQQTYRGREPAAPQAVQLRATWHRAEAGPIHQTGNPLDFALETPGWFRIRTPAGERLTRSGNFTRGVDGTLNTPEGYAVLDTTGQPIALGAGAVTVGLDGTITLGGQLGPQLGIVAAPAQAVTREGETLWLAKGPTQEIEPTQRRVRQGYLEGSNVNAMQELVNIVAAQRLFEMEQKLVDVTANQLARRALDLGDTR